MSSFAVARLQTDRLLCERLEPEHADQLARIMFEPSVLEWLWPEPEPPTDEDFDRALAGDIQHWETNGFGIWLLRDRETGQAVGRGGLRWTDATGDREVEVAWVIVPERRGQGLATELARAAVEVGFHTLGFPELIAYTVPHNIASRRVMEKAGFSYEREFMDEGIPHVLYRRSR